MSEEIVTIIDLADSVVDARPRREVKKQGFTYRVTYILVFNSSGQILVQKRTDTKDWCPGRFDLAAGGIIQFNESYELSARRELMEELGIEPPLNSHFNLFYDDLVAPIKNRNWGRVFSCIHEGPFELQADEVASVEFMSVSEALSLDIETVTPDTRQVLIAYHF
ncbi:MAG: NUDIX domain-containing protein [Arenicellales bacterium]